MALAGCSDDAVLAGMEATALAVTGGRQGDPELVCGSRIERDFPVTVGLVGDITVNFDNGCERVPATDGSWTINCAWRTPEAAVVSFREDVEAGGVGAILFAAEGPTGDQCLWSYQLRDVTFSYCGDPGVDCP